MSTVYRRLFGVMTAVFAVGLCVAVPLVVNLILYSIDPSTHFYYDNAQLVPVANGLFIALTVVMIVPIFLKRAGASSAFAPGRKPAIAFFSALMALALCVDSVYDIGQTLLPGVGVGDFVTGIAGFLSLIFFLSLAESCISGRKTDLRLIALLPVLWGVIRLITTFMHLTQVANISQYLYEVLQMVFAILFLYYNARLVGSVSNSRELNGVFAFGLPCAFFGLLATLPPVIANAMNSHRGNPPTIDDAVYLAMSLYILAVLIRLLVKRPSPAVEPPAEETGKAEA